MIRNSTIVGNNADSPDEGGGGIFREGFYAGGGVYSGRDVELSSTIVANNTAAGEPDLSDSEAINDDSEFELGFSLIEDLGNAAHLREPRRLQHHRIDPELGPLAAQRRPDRDPPAGALEPGTRRRHRQRPHIRPARPAAHLRRGGDRQQRRLRRHRHRFGRAAAGRERPARQRLVPGRRGRLEDRHRGPRHADRHRRPRRALRRRRRRRPQRPRRQRLPQRRRRQRHRQRRRRQGPGQGPGRQGQAQGLTAARTSSRAPEERTRQTAAAARTRSPAAPARTRSRAARARTSSRATAARTSSRPLTQSATRSTAAAATRTRPRSTPRTRSRPTARR